MNKYSEEAITAGYNNENIIKEINTSVINKTINLAKNIRNFKTAYPSK